MEALILKLKIVFSFFDVVSQVMLTIATPRGNKKPSKNLILRHLFVSAQAHHSPC